jgi:hypothetical protein
MLRDERPTVWGKIDSRDCLHFFVDLPECPRSGGLQSRFKDISLWPHLFGMNREEVKAYIKQNPKRIKTEKPDQGSNARFEIAHQQENRSMFAEQLQHGSALHPRTNSYLRPASMQTMPRTDSSLHPIHQQTTPQLESLPSTEETQQTTPQLESLPSTDETQQTTPQLKSLASTKRLLRRDSMHLTTSLISTNCPRPIMFIVSHQPDRVEKNWKDGRMEGPLDTFITRMSESTGMCSIEQINLTCRVETKVGDKVATRSVVFEVARDGEEDWADANLLFCVRNRETTPSVLYSDRANTSELALMFLVEILIFRRFILDLGRSK